MAIFPTGTNVLITPSGGSEKAFRLVDDPKTGARGISIEKLMRLGAMQPGIRETSVPLLYEWFQNDWVGGYGERVRKSENRYYWGDQIDSTNPGELLPSKAFANGATSAVATQGDPVAIFDHGASAFIVAGRYCYNLSTATSDQDFGSGVIAQSTILWNGNAYVAFGSGSNFRQRTAAGVWSTHSSLTANHFTSTSDGKIWRAYTSGTNVALLANSSTGATFMTADLFSAGYTVGDPGTPVTGLAALGTFVFVAKEDGLYAVNASGDTFNLTPELSTYRDARNGKGVFVWHNKVFYPHVNGLFAYDGSSVQKVSPPHDPNGLDENQPMQGRVLAMAGDDEWLYAVIEPLYLPERVTTESLKTVNNESTFTAYGATTATLDALDTAANGDYFYVGYTSRFSAFRVLAETANAVVSELTPKYWDGSAWQAMTSHSDRTSVNGATLAGSGHVAFVVPSDWAQKTINGTAAYWVRCQVSVALSATVRVRFPRVTTDFGPAITSPVTLNNENVKCSFVRGRETASGMEWHAMGAPASCEWATAIAVTSKNVINTIVGGHVLVFGRGGTSIAATWIRVGPRSRQRSSPPTGDQYNAGIVQLSDADFFEGVAMSFYDVVLTAKNLAVADANIDYLYSVDGAAYATLANWVASGTRNAFTSGNTGTRLSHRVVFYANAGTLSAPVLESIRVRAFARPPVNSMIGLRIQAADGLKGCSMQSAWDIISTLEGLIDDNATVTIKFEGNPDSVTALLQPQGFRVIPASKEAGANPEWTIELQALVTA